VATLEISESKETKLEELCVSGGEVSCCSGFRAYNEKGIDLDSFRVSDVLAIVINKKLA